MTTPLTAGKEVEMNELVVENPPDTLERQTSNGSISSASPFMKTYRSVPRGIRLMILIAVVFSFGMLLDERHLRRGDREFASAMYFTMTTMATIGYGDFHPLTQGGKFLTTLFILACLIVVSYALTTRFSEHVSTSDRRRALKLLEHEGAGVVTEVGRPTQQALIGFGIWAVVIFCGTAFYAIVESCSCGYGPTWVGNAGCPEHNQGIDYNACIANGGKAKSWLDAFYFIIVTCTTVGFGDYTPMSRVGRWFSLFWTPLALYVTGLFVQKLSEAIFDWEEEDRSQDFAKSLAMDKSQFDKVDFNRNGLLSRGEFYEYLLVKHDFVPREIMDLLRAKFDALDTNNDDVVSWAEVEQAAVKRQEEVNAEKARAKAPRR